MRYNVVVFKDLIQLKAHDFRSWSTIFETGKSIRRKSYTGETVTEIMRIEGITALFPDSLRLASMKVCEFQVYFSMRR